MRRLLVFSFSFFVLACADPGGFFSGASSADAAAESCPLEPGVTLHEIMVDGVTRSYWLNVGPAVGHDDPAPVVFLWHGWGGSARSLSSVFDPARAWPEAVTVAPVGLRRRFPGMPPGKMPGWQIVDGEFGDRDLKLFDALAGRLTGLSCVDSRRIYSMGFSNGGYFSNLLGCQRPDVVAAIVPVSGGGPHPPVCEGEVAVQVVHGTRDRVVEYSQGKSSFRTWQRANDCAGSVEASGEGCVAAAGCSREVRMCSFDGGHVWPRELHGEFVSFLKRHQTRAPEEPSSPE